MPRRLLLLIATGVVAVAGVAFPKPASAGFSFTVDLSATHSPTAFTEGQNGGLILTLTWVNGTPTGADQFTVTDTLPNGLTFISSSNAAWGCAASGQTVTCAGSGSGFTPGLSGSNRTSTTTLTVGVGPAAHPSVSNSAHESDLAFSNGSTHQTATDPIEVGNAVFQKAPSGAYPTILQQFTVDSNENGDTFTATDGTKTVVVTVPVDALQIGTQVTVYVGSAPVLNGDLPGGSSYVDGYAVGWVEPDGSTGNATLPLTITVTDSAVKGSDTLYVTSAGGLTQTSGTVNNGSWSTTFTADPGFVVASPAAAATPAPTSTTPGTPSTGAAPLGALGLGALLLFGGVEVVAIGRRRRGRTP